jgi:anti-sigma-K factor RskA
MDYSRADVADRLAAEYVMGTLRGPARRRFEQLLPAHPALRAAARRWETRLMPLTAGIAPETPSPAVWKAIVTRIGGAAPAVKPTPAKAPPWWSTVGWWRGLTLLTTAAAIGLSVMVANPPPSAAPIVVVLNAVNTPADAPAGAAQIPSIVASISGDGKSIVTQPLVNVSVQPDRTLELWAVPAAGTPRSLGLISASGASVVKQRKVPAGTAALAVSLEPPGGSTTGAPSGPVLYVGKLTL